MENQTFADYILSEKDWIKKMEIMYYLNKRGNVYFDNSVVFKTELLKLFLDNTPELNFDNNMLFFSCLSYSSKAPKRTPWTMQRTELFPVQVDRDMI